MSEYTKGPWELASTEVVKDLPTVSVWARECAVAVLFRDAEVQGSDLEMLANARLIAAAPSMYEALEAIAEGSEDADHARHCKDHRHIARDAIARAGGES